MLTRWRSGHGLGTLVLWTLCLVGTFNSWMVSGWAREREGVAMPGTPRWYTRWYTGGTLGGTLGLGDTLGGFKTLSGTIIGTGLVTWYRELKLTNNGSP